MTQPGRSFGKTRQNAATSRWWQSLRLVGPALALLLVLTACYQPVDPTPTPGQLGAPSQGTNQPPQPAPPKPGAANAQNKQNNPPPNAPGQAQNPSGGGGGGQASPAATPATPLAGTPPSSPIGPPPRITVTPTTTRTTGPGAVINPVNVPTFGAANLRTPSSSSSSSSVNPPPAAPTATKIPPKPPAKVTPTATKKATVTVTTTATGQTGGIIIAKLDPDKKPVAGACFALLDDKQKQVVTACDQGDGDVDPNPGTIQINGIPPGQYTLRETLVPAGYVAAPDQVVGILGGKTFETKIVDEPDTSAGTILISKVDPAGTPVEGSCFAVSSASTPVAVACDGGEGDADPQAGQIRIEVPPGSYSVAETPPTGYAPAAPATVTVAAGQFSNLQVVNQPVTPTTGTATQTGTLTIHVRDASNQPVGGACFSVQLNDASHQVCDDDKDGDLPLTNVPPGEYTLHEVTPPDGYTGADDQTAKVEGGKATEATFVNELAPTPTATTTPVGTLQVQVVDESGQPLTGACFSLTPRTGTPGEKQSLCDKDDGADDGQVTFTNLPPGTWRLREYQPPQGYQEPESVDVPITAGETAQQTVTNTAVPTTGSLQITKVDDQGQPLGGACFDLVGEQSFQGCDNEQGDADNAAGVILLQGLPPGDYQVQESRVPDGYQAAENQTVTISAGGDPATLSFTDMPAAPTTQPTVAGGQPTTGEPPTSTNGVTLSLPAVYQDDQGHLWLLQPGDSAPTRLDSNDLPFNSAVKPIFSADHSWLAFFVTNNNDPASNLTLYDVKNHQPAGQVPFGGVGTPVQIAWLPGSNDQLAVAAQAPSGATVNVYIYRVLSQDELVPLFNIGSEPAAIDALSPAPTGSLLAIQTTGSDGDTDVFIDDTSQGPNPINVGPNNGDNPDTFVGWSPDGSRLLLRSGNPEALFATDISANATQLGTTAVFPGDSANGTNPRWSADGSHVAFFDADPQSGGQLQIAGLDGSSCPAVPGVISFDWSPTDPALDALITAADQPIHLVRIGFDCSQQPITDFNEPVDNLMWSPNGQVLAVVNQTDSGATAWLVSNGAAQQIDANVVGFSSLLGWSPTSDALVLFAGGPPATMWVVQPSSTTPVPVTGSTLPDGSNYITNVWWP